MKLKNIKVSLKVFEHAQEVGNQIVRVCDLETYMCREKKIIHQIFDIICDCHFSRCESRENGMFGRKEQKERERGGRRE